jgi:nitrogen fixation protein FixH
MNTGTDETTTPRTEAHRFSWQRAWPLWILSGFFGVIFTVNGLMAYLGAISFTGLTTEDAYEKGRTYNSELARADVQKNLGWSVQLQTVPQQAAGRHLVELRLNVAKADKSPVTGGKVQVLLVRPTHEGYDRNVALTEATPGVYSAHVELPLAGQWEVRALVTAAAKEFRLIERISVD